MKLNIPENIRRLRRERGYTQEQLAEALGVTVGAVSKWESGANAPDIAMVAELADFFDVSIDMLMGFEVGGGVERALERITGLAMDKRFAEAAPEMEKALVKYPNDFRVVRLCASTYCLMGVELSDEDAHRRQLELYRRALTLIDQNTEPGFSRWSIENRIAEAHICLGEYDKGLELLKANNAQGMNSGNIAQVLTENVGRCEEGLDYMFDDLVHSVTSLMNDTVSGIMAYVSLGRPRDAERMLDWALGVMRGLTLPGKVCNVQRACARMQLLGAYAALADERVNDAERRIREAHDLLREYAAAPDNSLSGTWVKNGGKYRSFDDLGDDVMAGARAKLEKLQKRLDSTDMTAVWDRLTDV